MPEIYLVKNKKEEEQDGLFLSPLPVNLCEMIVWYQSLHKDKLPILNQYFIEEIDKDIPKKENHGWYTPHYWNKDDVSSISKELNSIRNELILHKNTISTTSHNNVKISNTDIQYLKIVQYILDSMVRNYSNHFVLFSGD